MKLAPSLDPRPQSGACALMIPPWVSQWVRGESSEEVESEDGLRVTVCRGMNHVLASVQVERADDLSRADFQDVTTRGYRALFEVIRATDAPHPVRFWNFIPHIRKSGPDGIDRYMVFNAGRFAALTQWFGGQRPSSAHVATASGVGHHGPDLVVHVLAARKPGQHVENPRQVPSFEYSRKYGPVPPCFARATWVDESSGKRALLVGGTSSVCGEMSVHPGDAAAQTHETVTNLLHLLRGAPPGTDGLVEDLSSLSAVRVYYVNESDHADVAAVLRNAFKPAALENLEYVRADLCRSELLVEIEGVADQF